jgi:predicted anti-sigma-YlaC factor YlaD
MNCKFTTNNLTFFLDDEIQIWKKWFIKHHLQKCKKCQRELAKIKRSNEIFISTLKQNPPNLDENELWQNISTKIPETNTEIVKVKWKSKKAIFNKKTFYYSFGAAIILLIFLVSFSQFGPGEQKQISSQPEVQKEYPVVESINKENVMVMTYLTDDPTIKIVWFFED